MALDRYQLYIANESLKILLRFHKNNPDKQMRVYLIRSEIAGLRHLDLSGDDDAKDRKEMISHIEALLREAADDLECNGYKIWAIAVREVIDEVIEGGQRV